MASSTIGTAQDYATVTLWESNEQRDLVTATEIEEGQCLDEVFTEAVTISGWTTSSSYYPKLTAQGGTGFDGVAGNGPRVTHASADVIYSVNADFYMSFMEVYGGDEGVYALIGGASDAAKTVWIESCIIHDTGGTGIEGDGDATYPLTINIWNCIVYDTGGNGMDLTDAQTTAYVENCSLYDPTFYCYYGNGSTSSIYNCVAHRGASSSNCYRNWSAGDYNADGIEAGSDSSAPGGNSLNDQALSDIDWVSTVGGSEDLHIQGTSTLVNAANGAVNITFSDDIDGVARPGVDADWDIGADEYVAPAVGVAVPIFSKDGIHSLVFGRQIIMG